MGIENEKLTIVHSTDKNWQWCFWEKWMIRYEVALDGRERAKLIYE